MAKNNDLLNRMQLQKDRDELMAKAAAIADTKQAMYDAIALTAGYGSSMGKRPWGEQKIVRFCKEVEENYKTKVFPGLTDSDDADGYRNEVDELLRKKCPKSYLAREYRYPFRTIESIESEITRKQRERKKKKRK